MEREQVLMRLRAWTTGREASSGEPLPLVHALRHTQVHATLSAALALLEGASTVPPRPRNAGRAWSPDEDAALGTLYDAGTKVAGLAESLGRTRGAITARLVKLGRIEAPPGLRLRA